MKFNSAFTKDFDEQLDKNARLAPFPEAIQKYKIFADDVAKNDHMVIEKLEEFSEYSQDILQYNPHVEPIRRESLSDAQYRKDLNIYIERMRLYHESMYCFIGATRMELYRQEAALQKKMQEDMVRQRHIQKIDIRFMETDGNLKLLKLEKETFMRAMPKYKTNSQRMLLLNAKRPVIE